MTHISDAPIVREEQTEQETTREVSALFPEFSVTEQGIFEESTGETVPDTSIFSLGLSTRISNSLQRWGMLNHKLTNGAVMLSTLLSLSEKDVKDFQNLSQKTREDLYKALKAYIAAGSKCSKSELLSGWTPVGANLMHTETGRLAEDIPVYDLQLNSKVTDALSELGIYKVSDFIGVSGRVLLGRKNIGIAALATITDQLDQYLAAPDADDGDAPAPPHTADRGRRTKAADPSFDCAGPVLAEEYALVDGKIIRRSDHAQIVDAPIEALDLSVRGRNCMHGREITNVSQLIGMPFEDFRSTRNLGVGTSNEIIEKLEAYLACHTMEEVTSAARSASAHAKVKSYFENDPFGSFRKEDIPKLFASEEKDVVISAIRLLLRDGTVVLENGRYCRKYPSFFSVLEEFLATAKGPDLRAGEVVQLRAEGKTLEEIGQAQNVSRERIRQMEKKAFTKVIGKGGRHFVEDKFAYLYENYAMEKGFLEFVTEYQERIIYYLKRRYENGSRSLEDAPDDKKISVELRRRIEKWLNKNYFFADAERIHLDRISIEDHVLMKYCTDRCSFDEFCERYNQFLLSCELPPEKTEALLLTSDIKQSRANRLSGSRKLLRSQNHYLRYYDIDSIDTTELFEGLNLGQFENVEISARKLFCEHPELMEKYDIRDECELHNLLRKLDPKEENPSICFIKMPHILFGTFSRDQAVREMMFALAPISAEELSEKLSEEYGHRAELIRSNWLFCINEYYHRGVFSVDYQEMPEAHMELLKENLKDDFYYFGDIKKVYCELLPNADVSMISSFNLKRMGFNVNGTYAFRSFDSAEAYFRHLLTCREIVDASVFHDRLKRITMYGQVLKELKRDYSIIEFEPMQYISRSRLERLGITPVDLRGYCDAVYDFVGQNSYFTLELLKHEGFTSPLDSLGFGTQFYTSLLREDPRFANWWLGYNTVFYAGNTKFSGSGCHYVSIKAFVADYLEKVRSIDIDELLSVFEDEYNIRLDRRTVIDECKSTSLYYDRVMEKLYIDYDTYFEEI